MLEGGSLSGPKTKKIIALVETVLIGKGLAVWLAGFQAYSVAMHSKLGIDSSHNFLEYALPFTIMASPVPTKFVLVSIHREKRQARAEGALVQNYGSLMHVFI